MRGRGIARWRRARRAGSCCRAGWCWWVATRPGGRWRPGRAAARCARRCRGSRCGRAGRAAFEVRWRRSTAGRSRGTFTFLSRLTQIATPHTRFVFLGAGIRPGLPSHPASRRRSCLRLGVSTTSSSRGLHPQAIAHAGRTQGGATARRRSRQAAALRADPSRRQLVVQVSPENKSMPPAGALRLRG